MADGLTFYWFSWLFWGITTFFLKKGTLRTTFSVLILASILFSNIHFWVGKYLTFSPFLFVLITSLFFFTTLSRPLYHLFCSFILMIGYTAILFWKNTASIYILMPDFFLWPLLYCIITLLMVKGLYHRIIISILGAVHGEILHGLILSSYHLPETLGGQDFFIILYMTLLYQLLLDIYKKVKTNFYDILKSTIKF